MRVRTTCLAVVSLLLAATVSSVAKKGTFPALDKKNPVCTFAVDKIRIKGDREIGAAKFYKKSKACKGPQGYAIQDCQLKKCQCRKFHTHVDVSTNVVTTWAECLPKIKDATECVGADYRYCQNLLRGKDPLSKSAAGSTKYGRNASDAASSSSSSTLNSKASSAESKSLTSGSTASTINSTDKKANDAASFPVAAVVLVSVGVIGAVLGGTWIVVSKKKAPKSTTTMGVHGGGGGGNNKAANDLEFDDFEDEDHKDLYTDAQSTSAAVHTVAPPARSHSTGSISSVSSSDESDDDDDATEDAAHLDSWTSYSKK